MTLALAGGLLVLALIDSTSFGTLLIPLWLLLAPGPVRPLRIVLFLGTVAAAYLALGLALLAGVSTVLPDLQRLLAHPVVSAGQLVLGGGMLLWALLTNWPKRQRNRPPGRLTRWRQRIVEGGGGRVDLAALIGLALTATAVEAATMLPYLAAIGMLATSGLAWLGQAGTMVGYCLVMILPALLLVLLRLVAHRRVEPLLARVARFLERTAPETTAWIVGIVGFFVARDALGRLPELSAVLPL